jgi:metallo-beta-lactamase family protein
MKIKFCGAAGEVTGSAHLILLDNGFSFLLDCGLYQGDSEAWKDFNESWLFDPKTLDCMVLSHAHIDHTGRIPKLYKDGFKGIVYATHATRDLCSLMLLDSAKIQDSEANYFNKKKNEKNWKNRTEKTPLYGLEDAKEAMKHFVGIPFEKTFSIHPDVDILFRDSGHMLGSASVTMTIRENGREIKLGFTGDIGRPNRPILKDPQPMPNVDYLICESTYGDKEHESAPDEFERFARIIYHTCREKKGKVLIPAFSVGRTQEIVYMLDKLANNDLLPRVPVYVDSPLSVNATEVFRQHTECFDEQLHDYMLKDSDPFGFNSLRYVQSTEESKALSFNDEPCIIIASSGMMNTGRIKHHLMNNIENEKNTVLIVGYCSPNTPGGQLRNGAHEIFLFGQKKQVKANIQVMDSFSAHGDRKEILSFLENQKSSLKNLYLVHGEPDTQKSFIEYLNQNGFDQVNIQMPSLGTEISI